MTYDPEQQRRRGHVPDLPEAIEELSGEAARRRRRGRLAQSSRYGMSTTSSGAGSGGPTGGGTPQPEEGGGYHRFWASESAVEGVTAGQLVDGVRTSWDLEDSNGNHVVPKDKSEIVTYNGQYQYEGSGRGYTISGYTITFEFAPSGGQIGGRCVIGELTT